jgi:2-(1,2-epoxy-1,2-dihydrophenyl)acetyl-CoA isomerase
MANSPQPAPASDLVLESREGAVAVLALNRPDRLNALNVELGAALQASLTRVAADESVRSVVLTGAGRAFCSGGDLKGIHDARLRNAGHELESLLRAGKGIILALCMMRKPVVAAVNGPAAGAGMNIALACDMRIASDQASFGQNFAKVGLFPDFGGTWFLPRLAGTGIAAEMFYSGDMISADEAARAGIVNRVVPHDKFVEEVRALAGRLAAAPPIPAGGIKKVLFGSNLDDLERALDHEIEKQVECFLSEDCLEGTAAFFEKRKPHFKGR